MTKSARAIIANLEREMFAKKVERAINLAFVYFMGFATGFVLVHYAIFLTR